MKRFLSLLLAGCIAFCNVSTAFADSDSERLTKYLDDLKQTSFEADVIDASKESLSQAAVFLGKNLDGTMTFSHYINKKVMTLEEFNAFRWSFIFSQFIRPFQDNMMTVFDQDLFIQMESNGIQLQSVAEALASVENMDLAKVGSSGMMLQGSDFADLRDSIISDLYYLTLYDAYGGGVTVNDIFFGSGDAGQVYYVYDVVSGMGEDANEYYFDRSKLGTGDEIDGQFEEKAFPVFVLNNTSMLYLQVAFGSYLKSQDMDYGTFQEQWGNYNVYVDSFGNLCTYNGHDFVVFFPNFANSIFVNTEVDGRLEERVFAYNKWLSTAYSSSTRGSNTVQPDRLSITCLGGKNTEKTEELEDGTTVTTTFSGYSQYFHTYIRPKEDKDNIKNSMIFIDPPEVSPASVENMYMNGISVWSGEWELKDAAEGLAQENTIDKMVAELANQQFGNFGFWQAVKGTVSSPINQDGVLGFSGSSGESTDKYPLIQTNVSILKGQGFFTLPEVMNNILKKTTWRFEGFGILGNFAKPSLGSADLSGENEMLGESISASELQQYSTAGTEMGTYSSRRAPLAILNECYAVAMSWDFNKTIPNENYFQSSVQDGSEQYAAKVMFIRDDLIDYGQDMDVYLSEPGMYLPEWQMFWTGDTDSLLDAIVAGVKDMSSSDIQSAGSDTYKVYMPLEQDVPSKIYTEVTAPDLSAEDVEGMEELEEDYPGCATLNGGSRIVAFFDALEENATEPTWWGLSSKPSFESFDEFLGMWENLCGIYTIDSQEMLLAMINLIKQDGWDWDLDALASQYFLSQYYLLSRDNRISEKLGANTVNDIALVTYFWDRYYMPEKMAILGVLLDEIWYQKDWVQDNLTEGRESFDDWVDIDIFEEGYKGTSEEELDSMLAEGRESTLSKYIYDYLEPDDIVLLPFSDSDNSQQLRVYYTPHEELIMTTVYNKGMSGESEWDTWVQSADLLPNTVLEINYADLLMCLQKNTDYKHNYQIQPPSTATPSKTYNVEDLMNIAGEFATNPVSTINYILSGMMYDLHKIFGTGALGSSFDLNWLITNNVYLAVSDNAISLFVGLWCVMIIIRIFRYALARKGDSLRNLGMDCMKMVAVLLAPVIVLKGFMIGFSTTSEVVLKDAIYKSMLYETYVKVAERINADAAVDTEIDIFKQQFAGIQGEYDGLVFESIADYDRLLEEPVYELSEWNTMLENLKLKTTSEGWYDKDGFVPVHREYYTDSIFYFFYDYLKSSVINYYAETDDVAFSGYKNIAQQYNYADLPLGDMDDVGQRTLMALEQSFTMAKGGFRNMLRDDSYVYGPSILKSQQYLYDGPYMRDIFGTYLLFDQVDSVWTESSIQSAIQASGYWNTWVTKAPLAYSNNYFTKSVGQLTESESTWANPEVVQFEMGRDRIYTSVLDAYNSSINPSLADKNGIMYNQHSNPVDLTMFEQTLMKCIEDSYNEILTIADIMPTQVNDETLISVSAMILTFNLNNMFGCEPSLPVMNSLNMDMLMRAVMIQNLENLSEETNLMYALIDEGYGMLAIFGVVLIEILVAILFVVRIAMITVVIVLSIILSIFYFATGNRKLGIKTVIGVVSNYLVILALHAFTVMTVFLMVNFTTMSKNGFLACIFTLIFSAIMLARIVYLHFKALMILINNWRTLGGYVYSSIIKSKINNAKSAIANLQSRISRFRSRSENTEEEIQNAELSIHETSDLDVQNAESVALATVGPITSRMSIAENSAASTLWEPNLLDAGDAPHARHILGSRTTPISLDFYPGVRPVFTLDYDEASGEFKYSGSEPMYQRVTSKRFVDTVIDVDFVEINKTDYPLPPAITELPGIHKKFE